MPHAAQLTADWIELKMMMLLTANRWKERTDDDDDDGRGSRTLWG